MTVPFRPQVDGSRVAAQAGAIAVNAALLLALLAPIAPPILESVTTRDPEVVLIKPVRPNPVAPIKVPVVQPPRRSEPRAVQPREVAPPVQEQVIVPDGDLPADPPVEPRPVIDESFTLEPPAQPVAGTQLRYRNAPPPPYPREALRDGLTGTVLLEVLVDVDGRPLEAKVMRSSGHRMLDQAARRQVLARWRFEPAMQDGRAVQALGHVPVEFNLD